MLKHATISRTSRAQQTLQLQRHWQQQDQQQHQHQHQQQQQQQQQQPAGCNQEREKVTTPTTTTPTKQPQCNSSSSSQGSMIKIFAQTLSQDVEYITLHVNTQTKSQQIIKTLLRKFRLKHRDPNLFHLTLERWIRKDGLRFKSVMLLGDEACPLQLQQCCSNPPHDDIKFTLQKRSGTLVKIYCSDVLPDAKYKCLPLSTQTTVEETIELMLYCLNFASQSTPKHNTLDTHHHHQRTFSASPNCSSSASSSSSDTSFSSGIESEPNNNNSNNNSSNVKTETRLDSDADSRASSVTSISSSSNVSSLSSGLIDQFCLVIECKDSSFERVLHPDEYLVDVYQNLLAEANKTQHHHHLGPEDSDSGLSSLTNHNSSSLLSSPSSTTTTTTSSTLKQSPDQWFFIKLKRRYENNTDNSSNSNSHSAAAINYVNPRQLVPLPPIPDSLFKHQQQQQMNNSLRHFVSTTQIEVNRPGSSLAFMAPSGDSELMRDIMGSTPITLASQHRFAAATTTTTAAATDEVDSSNQTPPPIILLTPPVRPRRRNLSNASSTFGRPLIANNRRRYDPAQLAEDLDQLNISGSAVAPVATGD